MMVFKFILTIKIVTNFVEILIKLLLNIEFNGIIIMLSLK